MDHSYAPAGEWVKSGAEGMQGSCEVEELGEGKQRENRPCRGRGTQAGADPLLGFSRISPPMSSCQSKPLVPPPSHISDQVSVNTIQIL